MSPCRSARIGAAEGARGLAQRVHSRLVAGLGAGGQLSGDLHRRRASRQQRVDCLQLQRT